MALSRYPEFMDLRRKISEALDNIEYNLGDDEYYDEGKLVRYVGFALSYIKDADEIARLHNPGDDQCVS